MIWKYLKKSITGYSLNTLQEEFEDDGGGLAPFSVAEILEHCIEPTVTDGLRHMGKIIVWCLLFRLVTQTVQVDYGHWTVT